MDHKIQVLGFKSVPPYAQPVVLALGLAAINWGKLEQQLDILLHAVNREKYATGKYRQTPNTSFRMKVDLFHQWYAKDPRFGNVSDRARRLTTTLRVINKDRQFLFHSNVQEFLDGTPPKISIVNYRSEGEDAMITRGEWGEKEILNFALATARFTEGLATISRDTMNEPFRQSLEKAESQTQKGIGLVRRTKRIICALARRLERATCH